MKYTAKAISSLIFGVVVLMCACQGRTQERLEQVDSLLSQDNVDAAYMYLNALPSIEEENKGDVAYHTLLKTEILYRTGRSIVNDSIDYSIFYYEQNGPSDKLARAYYLKVSYNALSGTTPRLASHSSRRPRPSQKDFLTSLCSTKSMRASAM